MSKHAAYTPKHRGAPERPLVEAPKKALKKTLVLSAIAVAGTGTTVGGGLALSAGPTLATAADVASPLAHSGSSASTPATPAATSAAGSTAGSGSSGSTASTTRRTAVVSRSDRRDAVDPAKEAALATSAGTAARAVVQTEDMTTGDPKTLASAMLGNFGWSGDQFGCLESLWNRESGWNVHAANPTSSAYGIPQALPGSKMASAGPDWPNNAETQIKWGLGYIQDRYGSPCGAWGHSQSYGWY
ncbi:lytic transglycosylase domain-containing protein [Nocardioides sp. BP30]|uniref:aggregation-promoting factor C-terminal-like domain-containing protein n=1 Tax=Nocardioides sp. BP30 TaxID=3036374 RepID=UPI002469AB65|nr:lytic transglycosylase domain-containing protein [Nocardioides sp. BP30]WGL53392.1 lytic transglycosylase domain-containing protein [Nocardioides sp. BP30]